MYKEICQAIHSCHSFVVISHIRPDGDATGSTIALGLALRSLGKKVRMWNRDGAPSRFSFLEGSREVECIPPALPEDVDCFICVDTADLKRIGDEGVKLFNQAPLTLNIDHHHTNKRYADHNAVGGHDAACGCLIYELLRVLGVKLNKAIADALYAAISTDTGSFKYSSTTPRVMRIVADIMEAGVDVGEINRMMYDEKDPISQKVEAEVLTNMMFEENGAISHYSMTKETKERLQLDMEATKDLVDIIRGWQGVKACAIFEEEHDDVIRISLRSKDPRVDVSTIAGKHGGGGHCMAAGIRMRGELAACREAVLNTIKETLRSLS